MHGQQNIKIILLSTVTCDHPVLTCKTPQLEVPSSISTHFENRNAWRLASLLKNTPRFISLLLSPFFRMQGALFSVENACKFIYM